MLGRLFAAAARRIRLVDKLSPFVDQTAFRPSKPAWTWALGPSQTFRSAVQPWKSFQKPGLRWLPKNWQTRKARNVIILPPQYADIGHVFSNSRGYYSYGSYNYQPQSNPQRVIWGIIGVNVAGFALWRVDPRFMARHATVSYSSLADGRIWTLLTAAFSHQDGFHLFANMFTFYFFASTIPRLYGTRALIGLYVAGGIAGSLAHVGWSTLQASQGASRGNSRMEKWDLEHRRRSSRPALGASAAINSIVIAQICLFPSQTVLVYGILPMPAAVFGLLWIAGDIGGILGGEGRSNTSFAGHLGGATCGLAFYTLARRGFFRR